MEAGQKVRCLALRFELPIHDLRALLIERDPVLGRATPKSREMESVSREPRVRPKNATGTLELRRQLLHAAKTLRSWSIP